MKFYIASKLENAETVKRVAAVLKAAGHDHTYDWTEHGSVQKEGQERLTQVAELEKNGVKEADMIIVILPGGRGTHAELGIALGAGVKSIIICAEKDDLFQADESTCAFYWNYAVTRVTGQIDDWLTEILNQARRLDFPYAV
jgi:nucleoside 2-deoxyribosyltransferase